MTVGTIGILGSAIVFFTPIINIASRPMLVQSKIQPCDAIVVLGSGLMSDGSLSYESLQRLMFGLRLYKEGLAPTLILSGTARSNTAPESTTRARIAVELGVPSSAIFEINTAHTTREEAGQILELLKPRNQKRVLLVTEALHMLRAKLVFEAAGLDVSPAASDNFPKYAASIEERLFLLRGLLMQSAGLLYYRIAGFI